MNHSAIIILAVPSVEVAAMTKDLGADGWLLTTAHRSINPIPSVVVYEVNS